MVELDRLRQIVDESALEATPFDHVYLDGVFPEALYVRVLEHLPDIRYYRELRHCDAIGPDGRSARRKFYLYPEHIWFLPRRLRAFWLGHTRILRSRELQDAFKRKFKSTLEQRFGRSIDRLTFYPIALLVRDRAGYRISIHSDIPRKAITVQFYLPPDETQVSLGTILHEGLEGEAAGRTRTLAFRPASGYAFPVVEGRSWHSVARVPEGIGERNSLILTYFVQNGPWDWLSHRIKRLLVFIGYGLRR